MGSWERFDETSLSDKKAFYSEWYLKDTTHAQKVFKEFKFKNLADYHDLYVQSDTLLLADVFENCRNKCTEIYELNPAHFLSAPRLVWHASLKRTWAKLELLTNIDMLLMVEKGIRGGICHSIHRYAKANNKYMKNYDKDMESSYFEYLDANNFYGWTMSQKLPVNAFESQFKEDFIKNYDEDSNKGYFLEVDVEYPKKLFNPHMDLRFLKERKSRSITSLFVPYRIKKTMLCI